MGPDTYDLASLLRDSYVDLPEQRGRRADRVLPGAARAGTVDEPRDVPPPLRPDGAAAQPEGAGHVRLPDDRAPEPGLHPVHPAHAGATCATTWPAIPSFARLRRTLARHSRASLRRHATDDDVRSRSSARTWARPVHAPGLAPQQALERQAAVPDRARRHRLHPGGDVEGGGRPRGLRARPSTLGQEASLERRRQRARRRARARRLRDRRHAARRGAARSHDYPITPKEHGVDFLMDHRHLWIRSPRQHAILRVRHEVDRRRAATTSTRSGFILADTPIFTPAACEGTTTLFAVQYFDESTAYLTQSGQLYNEATAMALGKRLLLRPDVPRREVEDAPAPDRVLDGRARDRLRRRSTTRSTSPRTWSSRSSSGCSRSAPARAEGARARHVEARGGEAAVPAHHLRRGGRRSCAPKGCRSSGAATSAAPTRRVISEAFDRPVVVHRFPSAIKAFYMEPDPERARRRARRRHPGARGLRRDHRRRRAPGRRRAAAEAHPGARAAGGGVRLVSRPAPLRLGPARRLRHGHRALVTWICGIEHLRETIPFPRMLYRIYP